MKESLLIVTVPSAELPKHEEKHQTCQLALLREDREATCNFTACANSNTSMLHLQVQLTIIQVLTAINPFSHFSDLLNAGRLSEYPKCCWGIHPQSNQNLL